jgi:hypothetical protein
MKRPPIWYIPLNILSTQDLPSLHEPVPPPDQSPVGAGERRLLLAILRQVLVDCISSTYRAQAEAWLRSRACDALCELLDLDAAQVRQLVQQDLPGLRNRLGRM